MEVSFSHPYVRELKARQTEAEHRFRKIIKRILRDHFPDSGVHYQSQVPIAHSRGFYILDFYICGIRTAFEIDGGYHWQSQQLDKDLARDRVLWKEKRIVVYHFANKTVLKKTCRQQKFRALLVRIIRNRIATTKMIKTQQIAAKHGWKKIQPAL